MFSAYLSSPIGAINFRENKELFFDLVNSNTELNILQMGVYFCNEIYSISCSTLNTYDTTVAADTSSAGVQEYREDNETLIDAIIVRRGCGEDNANQLTVFRHYDKTRILKLVVLYLCISV